MAPEKLIFLVISCALVMSVASQSPFTNDSLLVIVGEVYRKVLEYQVPKTEHFFPPFHFDEEQGMWPSDVRMNFHGNPDNAIFRDFMEVFDNNMFATTYVLSCLFDAKRYIHEIWYGPDHLELAKGLAAIKSHHDMNVNFSNSLMTFWPQKYNETLGAYNSYPINLNDVIKLTDEMSLNATYEFLEKLGLKNVEEILKHVMGIRRGYTMAFHIPPDFDDTFLNVGLGSIIFELSSTFPTYRKIWTSNNNNLTSVFDALKKYAYRPFSGDQRVNTIDPRTYYYLRRWLQQEKEAGNDVALVPTWSEYLYANKAGETQHYSISGMVWNDCPFQIFQLEIMEWTIIPDHFRVGIAVQDTDEVRTWFDKGVMMPFNVNNIDVTVCANFLFGVTSGIINGLFAPSLLDDPEIMQIYNDTSRMIAFQVQTNFSNRPDLALTYYPSVIEFYWFVARTYNQLEETIQRTGSLPHETYKGPSKKIAMKMGPNETPFQCDFPARTVGMEQVLADFKHVLRTYASPAILSLGTVDTVYGWDVVYFDDFLGNADFDYNNNSVNHAEDRIFTTSMALNALLTIWTTQKSGKQIWDKDAPENVKQTAHDIVVWLNYKVLSDEFEPWNAIFSGSYKGITTHPLLYPVNRLELFNGTRINRTEIHTAKYIQGVEGFIPEEEYEEMMNNIYPHYHTPTVFPGYNRNAEFFPFWSSEAYTYVIALLGLAKYIATM